jgi:hypothetical protein
MFILQVLVILVCIMIYVYTGLRLVESIKDESLYIYFWIAYIFFGITLFNIVIISKYWGKLSTKTAPPGPRGPRGEDGDMGPNGICNMDSNIVYAQKEIKDTIAKTIKAEYDNLALDDVYEEETLRLKNNYLDYKIKLMLTSKQFETVLLTPTDDNNPNKKTDETKVYGKTIEDLSGYLANIWREWIIGIINADKQNARAFFITNDAQIDISTKIEEYFNNEIMKYDVWYWGSTRVFRPLQAEICRSYYQTEDGKEVPNTRYPINNRPKIEVEELKFTDKSIKSDNRFELLAVLDIGDVQNWQKYNPDFNINYDVISKYTSTAFYIPKTKQTSAGQIFYPIGCVAVNNGDSASDIERSILIVSGDVIIPSSVEGITNNSVKVKDTQSDIIRYSRKRGAKKTKRYEKKFSTNTEYNVYLTQGLVDRNESYEIKADETRVQLASNFANDNVAFFKFKTDVVEYRIISDLPFKLSSEGAIPSKYTAFDNPKNYKGIVAIPKNCLDEIEHNKIWSFRYDKLLENYYQTNFNAQPIPKPAWIGSGNHSKGTKSFTIGNSDLKRTVVESRKFDIQQGDNNNKNELVKVRTPGRPNPQHYKIKEKCYKLDKFHIKNFDKKYEDLGFGWFGYPLKKYRKYSIFAYLGLMPEGIIVHRASGRKFYIKHYGGVEPNKFIVYLWSEKKKDFTNCVTVRNNTQAFIGIAKKTDPRCQFKVILDKQLPNYFRLEAIEYPRKYLKFDFEVNEKANLRKNNKNTNDTSLETKRPIGINLDHTEIYISLSPIAGQLNNTNPVIFFNQPATGTNMQIVEEDMPRNIDRSKSTNEQYKQQKILSTSDRNTFNYLNRYNEPIEIEPRYNLHPKSKIEYSK